jgi:hypothetical protein
LSVIPVKEQEFSPPAALDDLDPDEQHFLKRPAMKGRLSSAPTAAQPWSSGRVSGCWLSSTKPG